MVTIVFGSTYTMANNKLVEILAEIILDRSQLIKTKKLKDCFEIELVNGDRFIALCINENSKGIRWNYAYIDYDIDFDIRMNVIFRMFSPIRENGECDIDKRMRDCFEYYNYDKSILEKGKNNDW